MSSFFLSKTTPVLTFVVRQKTHFFREKDTHRKKATPSEKKRMMMMMREEEDEERNGALDPLLRGEDKDHRGEEEEETGEIDDCEA